MEEKYLVLSDIHGNVSAFDAVMEDCQNEYFAGVILLGDLIDYGMRSNEIVQKLLALTKNEWKDKVVINMRSLWLIRTWKGFPLIAGG